METSERYARFASVEAHGHSPSYEALALGVAGDPELIGALEGLSAPKRQPNLLFAATRYLGGPIEAFAAFRDWVLSGWEELAATMLARRTQTNEPGPQATLLPLLARLDGPLALLEVGAAAGLCLYPDRWSYDFSGVLFGDPALPVLACAVTGGVPIPTAVPEVCWRAGLDLNPLAVTDADDVRWLECLVWPEQIERRRRLAAALEIARADPPHLVATDLLTGLAELAAQAPPEATLVVFHSAVLAYVDPEARASFVAAVGKLPGHWIANEGAGVLGFPSAAKEKNFALALDGRQLAWAGPHGQSLEWLD